jgi:hypothetical protein
MGVLTCYLYSYFRVAVPPPCTHNRNSLVGLVMMVVAELGTEKVSTRIIEAIIVVIARIRARRSRDVSTQGWLRPGRYWH